MKHNEKKLENQGGGGEWEVWRRKGEKKKIYKTEWMKKDAEMDMLTRYQKTMSKKNWETR